MHKWIVAAVVLTATGMAQAQSQVPPTATATGSPYVGRKWTAGSSERGTRGVNRVEAAVPMPDGTWVLTASGRFSHNSSLLADGDTDTFSGASFVLAWQPIELLALTASWNVVSNKNDMADPRTTQSLGDPTLGIKLTHVFGQRLGVGLNSVLTLPTSAGGSGLAPKAFILDSRALVSYSPQQWLSLSANAGYRLDNTKKIFGNREISSAQRYTAGIAEKGQMVAGIGADTFFLFGEKAAAGPFAEVTGMFASGAKSELLASLGGRLQPAGKNVVDITVGADIRVSGKPPQTLPTLPGLAPWMIFARLSVYLGHGADEGSGVIVQTKNTCSDDDDCGKGQQCLDHVCTVTREVVREVTREVAKAEATFVIDGAVFDQTSGEVVSSAIITLSGYEQSPLAVDYKTGKFRSFPIPVGEGLMKVSVSAPNYRAADQTIPRGSGDSVQTVVFKIQSLGEQALGQMKGSLKDGRSGKPLKGDIFIPALSKRIQADKDGNFEAELKAGRYQVLISAPKYVTQKKEIEIRAGEVVILNLDMVGRR
jgi:hypothetical protein